MVGDLIQDSPNSNTNVYDGTLAELVTERFKSSQTIRILIPV